MAVRASHPLGDPENTDAEFAAEFFTRTLRRGFALAFSEDDFPNVFSFRNACDFLTHFAKQPLLAKEDALSVLCTADCSKLPLYNFPRFTALLSCLCLFCLSFSKDGRARVVFFVEQERGCVKISFHHDDPDALSDPDLFRLFEECFHDLDYAIPQRICEEHNFSLILCCNKAVPVGSIRTDEDREIADRLVQLLLARLLGQ